MDVRVAVREGDGDGMLTTVAGLLRMGRDGHFLVTRPMDAAQDMPERCEALFRRLWKAFLAQEAAEGAS